MAAVHFLSFAAFLFALGCLGLYQKFWDVPLNSVDAVSVFVPRLRDNFVVIPHSSRV